MKYSILLMDADGTLFDFLKAEKTALVRTLQKFSLPHNDIWVNTYSNINDSLWKALERGEITKDALRLERFRRLLVHFSVNGDVGAIAQCYTDELSHGTFLLPGAMDVCRELSKVCRLFIITNGIKEVQSRRFAGSGLSPYFEKCYISDSVGFEKPDVRFFEHVMADIPGFEADKALVVGDSLTSDILGANRAGLDCCWLRAVGKSVPDTVHVEYCIEDIRELPGVLGVKE